jgi:hypothetical protein
MSDPLDINRRLVAVFVADVESYKHGRDRYFCCPDRAGDELQEQGL